MVVNWAREKVLLGILLVCGASLLAGCKDELPEDQRWLMTVTEQIVQDHQQLAALTDKTHEQAQSFCRTPSENGLQKMQERWRNSMAAWQRVQWVRFGPVSRDRNGEKLQFWPDKDNILQRQVQLMLEGAAPVDADSLAEASVAVQGLSVQELLLFDSAFNTLARFPGRQCDFLVANAALTARLAKHLLEGWQDTEWLSSWLQPKVQNPGEASTQSRDGELLGAIVAQLEKIKTEKLGIPMGSSGQKPNAYFAESWRSDSSIANMQHNLDGLKHLVTPPKGYGLYQYLKEKQHGDVADELVIRLDNVYLALQQIVLPMHQAETEPGQEQALQHSLRTLDELVALFRQKVTSALAP